MTTAIQIDRLSKRYRIGAHNGGLRYRTFRDAVTDAARLPIRLYRSRSRLPSADQTMWALKDVSFTVQSGEVIGIIGRNGAGKSTLLRVLSRITEPTAGCVSIKGRVASLLEVGTGFHSELTGRENIYLNGAILGMSRQEIRKKLDEIVGFSEIERFVDTPVKRYSSGMEMRLAFAVAAHLEPEILLIDEVLAVGDAAFQKKCIGKMEAVASQGRTILFVSHNLSMVRQLCSRGVLLRSGSLAKIGPISDVVNEYTSDIDLQSEVIFPDAPEKRAYFKRFSLRNRHGEAAVSIPHSEPFFTDIEYVVNETMTSYRLCWMLARDDGVYVMGSLDRDSAPSVPEVRKPGRYLASVRFPGGILNEGTYQYRAAIASLTSDHLDYQYGTHFQIYDDSDYGANNSGGKRDGVILQRLEWRERSLDDALCLQAG